MAGLYERLRGSGKSHLLGAQRELRFNETYRETPTLHARLVVSHGRVSSVSIAF